MGAQQSYLPCKTNLQQLLLSVTMCIVLHLKHEQYICRNTNVAFEKVFSAKACSPGTAGIKKII